MRLADTAYDNSQTGCCAPVDRTVWDQGEWHWKDRPFLHDHIRAFAHIPLNFGAVISRDHAAIEAAEAWPEHPFWITDEVSPWGSEIYTATDRDLPGRSMTRMSGTFLTRVFEGPYRDIGRWTNEMVAWAAQQGKKVQKIYYFYATCPGCQKAFGKNEVVLFAKVD